jgi:hypothetical protein
MVCDFPVPGGPWMIRLSPCRAFAIAPTCVASAAMIRCWSDGGSSGGADSSTAFGSIEKDAVEGQARRVVLDQVRVVADQRHLAVVEIRQRHRAQVELPRVRIPFRLLDQGEHVPLRHRARHERRPRPRRRAGQLAQRQRRGQHQLLEHLQAERPEVGAVVAVVETADAFHLPPLPRHAAAILVEPLPCPLVDELDLRLVG